MKRSALRPPPLAALAALAALATAACKPGSAAEPGPGTGPGDPGTEPPPGSLFAHPMPWTDDVSAAQVSPESGRIIDALADAGGWGLDGQFRIDFSLEVLTADASTERRPFIVTDDFFTPDCDEVPMPVPERGALEGQRGYGCDDDGDCHLIVLDRDERRLYEMWRAHLEGGRFHGGCAVVWDLDHPYGDTLRGRGCTSADAAGLPIAALLPGADEVFAGELNHALRFILPNERIRRGAYVPPATHSTGVTSGGPDLPPYGARFRLRPDFDLDSLPEGGPRVVARALQRYGMFLADGGQIALTFQSDRFTDHRWSDVGIDPLALAAIRVEDFDVVELGEPIDWLDDTTCYRNPL